jgi:predicted naringenin-chalcone synthase
MHTILETIATANPPLRRSQEEAAAFMERVESLPQALRNRVVTIYERSAIDYRYSCVPDYGYDDPDHFEFFPSNWSLQPAPTTEQRNQKYREAVLPMAEKAARDALAQSSVSSDAITHVIAVSCTGFFAPGLDIELVKRLGLPADTQRTFIGFMGCYAAFNALRVAHGFCQSDPKARVLIVCAELCTLHFQTSGTLEEVVVNSLFSDGAAAAVLAPRSEAAAQGRLAYVGSRTQLDDDSMEAMTWDIGDTGFLMGLSSRVPDVIAEHLPRYLDRLLKPADLTPGDIDFWAIHPGGRAIVEKAQAVIGLDDAAVRDSLEVLRLHGNMSSPTVLFVLKRFLDRHRAAQASEGRPVDHGVAMAFGPGLTIEGALFQQM